VDKKCIILIGVIQDKHEKGSGLSYILTSFKIMKRGAV
jgi:hypothetical protein